MEVPLWLIAFFAPEIVHWFCGSIKTFDEYVEQNILPALEKEWQRNFSRYAHYLKEWFNRFDRVNQILVLSYDELKANHTSLLSRIKEFLESDFDNHFGQSNSHSFPEKVHLPSCDAQAKLLSVFAPMNEELYALLEANPGPSMEQRPFPTFELGKCTND